ncbi:hypothetical protein J11TS1_34840 [Oceanobacillus sp. J11TS1]|nr:hypothetical protein J11TS1_34840 [Oceanobacillus sp. J11TS1]
MRILPICKLAKMTKVKKNIKKLTKILESQNRSEYNMGIVKDSQSQNNEYEAI